MIRVVKRLLDILSYRTLTSLQSPKFCKKIPSRPASHNQARTYLKIA